MQKLVITLMAFFFVITTPAFCMQEQLVQKKDGNFKRPLLPSRNWVSEHQDLWHGLLLKSPLRKNLIKLTSKRFGQKNFSRQHFPVVQRQIFDVMLSTYLEHKNVLGSKDILGRSKKKL